MKPPILPVCIKEVLTDKFNLMLGFKERVLFYQTNSDRRHFKKMETECGNAES